MECFFTRLFKGSTTGESKLAVIGSAMLVNAGRRRDMFSGFNEETIYGVCNVDGDGFAVFDDFVSAYYAGRELVVFPISSVVEPEEPCEEILECVQQTG